MKYHFVSNPDPSLKKQIDDLQQEIFGELVDDEEVEEDFISPVDAYLVAEERDQVVGVAILHHSNVVHDGEPLSVAGFGICVAKNVQGKGIGSEMISRALKHLLQEGNDIAFLSAAPGTEKLYERFGYIPLGKPFTWENVKGEIKSDSDAMIRPLNSREKFERILGSKSSLHVGKGYW